MVDEYGMSLDSGLLAGISGRAVFVIDENRTVTYRWDDGSLRELPDLEALGEAISAV